MKRYGNLWPRIASFQHLLRAAEHARRGKRFRRPVARFCFDLERELWRLEAELNDRSYRPGSYQTFFIHEPKRRLISAAPFRDRVVHHALVRVLEPIFERSFIHDSYACRRGKGTHRAVDRCQRFAGKFRYVLKSDIQKYFPSIDHEILLKLVARKIKDPDVLWLVASIVAHSPPQEGVWDWFPGDDLFAVVDRRRGLPIGNQSSQFLANVYLDPLDHYLRDELAVPGYVRYVDDFLVFSDDKRELAEVRGQIEGFLRRLRLKLHADKTVILPVNQGIRFLGFRVFPTHRLLVAENVRRFRRRVRLLQRLFAQRVISAREVQIRLQSWAAHAWHASTYRLRARLADTIGFQRTAAE